MLASGTKPRSRTKNSLLKVVILGDGGVGKSCLMNQYVSQQFDEHSYHTIGVEFLNKDISVDGNIYTLQIWDTAGQERYKSLRTPFYRGSDICLLTYAINDASSFRNLITWKSEFLYYADIEGCTAFPFIVIGNKSDVGADEREISTEELQAWCLENSISSYIETSAKTADNVTEAFEIAVRLWRSLETGKEAGDLKQCENIVNLSKRPEAQNDNNCCLFIDR